MPKQTNIRPENAIAEQCLAVRLRMLNRVVTNIYDEALRPLGLKTSQLNIIVVAAKLGLARPAEVCDLLQLDTSTLSRNVERMKARGWLEIVPDEDGRAQPFRLTAKGRKLLQRAKPAWDQAQRKATKLLGNDAVTAIGNAAARVGFGAPNVR
jgi:DNA-binding MarR family transcriptional regulator